MHTHHKPAFKLAMIGVDHPHGAGWRESLQNLPGEIELTAIVPAFEGTVYSLEERYAQVPRFPSVNELIAHGDFEGAIVCLPNHQSVPALISLARAGKHVLAEKPVAASAGEMAKVVEAVTAADVAFQNGYMWRYDQGATRLRDMVRDGRFGKLISVEMQYFTSDVARRGPNHYLFDREVSGGGFFNWLACHWLDALLDITQDTVVGVTARVGNFGATPIDMEDGGAAILDLAGGGIATLIGGYWLPRWTGETRWNFRGSQRWVQWEPSKAKTSGVLQIHGPQPQFHAMEETWTIPEDPLPGYGGTKTVGLLRDWVAQSRGEIPTCRNTPQSTLATLQLIDLIYQSSREGRRLECQIGPA